MKKQRNLDGYKMPILRNGKKETVCLSDMTEEEITSVLKTQTKFMLMLYVRGLASRLYQIGELNNLDYTKYMR